MLNVVVLNGGRGAGTLIPALLDRQGLNVTSVVNAYDDGKSTGEMRRFFGMLGPSDIRKVQELMLPLDDDDYTVHLHLFRYRFPEDCIRTNVMAELALFADGSQNTLVGVQLPNLGVCNGLRRFVAAFMDGLRLIEKVRGEAFNFADCSLMNCIYAGAFLTFNRNIEQAALAIDRLFKLRGTVLPTSIEDKKLVALRENGEMLYSEAEIVELRSNVRIERVYLLDRLLDRAQFDPLSTAEKRSYLEHHHCYVGVSSGVKLALRQADIVIYAAGTQHSSLYPTFLSIGLAQSIADNRRAIKAFVTNIGADYETPSYLASDYIRGAYRYLNLSDARDFGMRELFDVVLINQSRLKADETYVVFDEIGFADVPVRRIVGEFESAARPGRHDGKKLLEAILGTYADTATLGHRA
jgi:2-phospho-L-lactate transferase/gluconeogenesis factor (CofD/UPF0052 family)